MQALPALGQQGVQRSVDYPEELGAAYHVVLDAGTVVTVLVEQVSPLLPRIL